MNRNPERIPDQIPLPFDRIVAISQIMPESFESGRIRMAARPTNMGVVLLVVQGRDSIELILSSFFDDDPVARQKSTLHMFMRLSPQFEQYRQRGPEMYTHRNEIGRWIQDPDSEWRNARIVALDPHGEEIQQGVDLGVDNDEQ